MKRIILSSLLLLPALLSAQTDYVQMKNCSGLCFIPSEYSVDDDANLHILQNDGVAIYDNNLSLIKSINLPQQNFIYQSSRTRTRAVEGVERTAIEMVEDLTEVYASYAVSLDKDFATLSYEEKQDIIVAYDKDLYYTDVVVRNESEFSLFITEQYYGDNFFYYPVYSYEYPKAGVLLNKDGKVYRFRASYAYKYSDWSDYKVGYDTIKVENNILACNSVGSQNYLSRPFYLSSSLFNEDESLEYIRPIYSLVYTPIYSWAVEPDPDTPVTSEGEYVSKELAISGIEIVSETGAVLGSISFGEVYDKIGNFSLVDNSIISIGEGVSILQLGENRFISFDTVDEEDGTTSIYKHFYKINVTTSSVEAVNAPVCVKVVQNNQNSIEVNYNTDKVANAELYSTDGRRCASQSIDVGSGSFRMNVCGSGTYILTISEEGTFVGTQKILAK